MSDQIGVKITFKGNNNSLKIQKNYFCNETLFFSSGLTATPMGCSPTGTVVITVFVAVSITETVPIKETLLPNWFATYTFFPSGVTATPLGDSPTGTVAVTIFVAVSITDVVLPSEFSTYTFDPSGLTATY